MGVLLAIPAAATVHVLVVVAFAGAYDGSSVTRRKGTNSSSGV